DGGTRQCLQDRAKLPRRRGRSDIDQPAAAVAVAAHADRPAAFRRICRQRGGDTDREFNPLRFPTVPTRGRGLEVQHDVKDWRRAWFQYANHKAPASCRSPPIDAAVWIALSIFARTDGAHRIGLKAAPRGVAAEDLIGGQAPQAYREDLRIDDELVDTVL